MTEVVAITGASGGVGRAVARRYGNRGAKVALIARGEQGLQAAAQEVKTRGGEPLVLPLDVSDAAAVQSAVHRIEDELGPIDTWINCAFTGAFARFTDLTPEEYRRATEVTYLGYVFSTMAVIKPMLERDRGTIVHVGSALAYRGIPLQTAYCGSKHAIQGFHESLRTELLHDRSNVHVTMVQLPGLNTPQFSWLLSRLPHQAQPVPPIYQPEIAARSVEYAADHPQRREYWVGFSTVATLLGDKFAPGLLDRYLARTAFSGQQTQQRRDPNAPVNLWEPADGPDGRDYGARGVFDDRSAESAVQPMLSRHHGWVFGVGGGLVASAAALLGRKLLRR